MSVQVSVVMPVYNAGKYLPAAVESILAQTMPDFELILVDDGSSDGSADVCDGFASRDSRVRVIHQRNAGICRARNVGMEAARGKWLAFCDHDDLYMPFYLELALSAAIASHCRVVKVGYTVERRFSDGSTEMVRSVGYNSDSEGVLSVPSLDSEADYRLFKSIATYIWDGIFDRDFVFAHNARFDERFKVGGEDVDFMLRLLSAEKNVGLVGEKCYRHFKNAGVSTSLRYSGNRNDGAIWNMRLLASLFPISGKGRVAVINDKVNVLFKLSFEHPDCPLSIFEKAEIVKRLFEALGSENMCMDGGGSLLWLASHGWFRMYVVLKSLARKVRKARRSLCQKK